MTLCWLQGTKEMVAAMVAESHGGTSHIKAIGSLLEWDQDASKQLTSGGYFCQQTVAQNCIYIYTHIYIIYIFYFVLLYFVLFSDMSVL